MAHAKTALVVDDSSVMREMVAQTLRKAGFELRLGANGQEGLDRLAAAPVDLIVTDVYMPVMDGISFVRAVRARPDGHKVPILILTTETKAEIKQQGKAAGASGWIVKPFNPDMLLQVVAKLLP